MSLPEPIRAPSSPGARLALTALTVFLVLLPLGLPKPGLPTGMKADEPAYYLMALSLALDGDLRCEERDLERMFQEFPYREVENVILMTDDAWRTVYYGKPYAYSLFAAPLAGPFGANGLIAFNLLLLMTMVWMGRAYLRRFNTDGVATVFSAGFFLVSLAFAYAFWMHPEVFMMTSVMASLFLALHRPEPRPAATVRWRALWRRLAGPQTWPFWSGGALALGVYHKPMLVAIGLPAIFDLYRRRGWKAVAAWIAGLAVLFGLLAGGAIAMTGHPSAYLGVQRQGFKIDEGAAVPVGPMPDKPELVTKNSWTWLARIPDVDSHQLLDAGVSFLVGRHTGLAPYLPFSVLAVFFFLLHGRRSTTRWLVVAALGSVALFFLIWIPFNWHGGGGFVGNRYFVNVYPAFLFLVTAIKPRWLTHAGYGAGALFLGSLLFTPWGAPVTYPTLQAYVRGKAQAILPGEATIMRRIPGYTGQTQNGAWLRIRKDVGDFRGDLLWIQGGEPAEIWMVTAEPIASAVFEIHTEAPNTDIRLRLPGDSKVVSFRDAVRPKDKMQIVDLDPGEPRTFRPVEGNHGHVYRLVVDAPVGRVVRNRSGAVASPRFYLGAAIRFLGTRELLDDPANYRVDWRACEVPATVAAEGEFEGLTRLVNASPITWTVGRPTQVALSYHWIAADGTVALYEGLRTALDGPIEAGAEIETVQSFEAPPTAGIYTLRVDLVRENIAWFSDRNGGNTCEATVEVVEVEPDGD